MIVDLKNFRENREAQLKANEFCNFDGYIIEGNSLTTEGVNFVKFILSEKGCILCGDLNFNIYYDVAYDVIIAQCKNDGLELRFNRMIVDDQYYEIKHFDDKA